MTAPRTLAIVVAAALALGGCATRAYVPGYDTDREDGAHAALQKTDLSQCVAQADKLAPKANWWSVGLSTAVGVVPGLAVANPVTAIGGAVVGGVNAGAGARQKAADDHTRIVRNCMLGRGHAVIDEKG